MHWNKRGYLVGKEAVIILLHDNALHAKSKQIIFATES
jgi:hypothetical protein